MATHPPSNVAIDDVTNPLKSHDYAANGREARLRERLKEKPRNAKLMYQLVCLMVERSQQTGAEEVREEASSLAQKAIQIAPQRPFGYAAQSVASRDHSDRIESLKRAIELSATTCDYDIARASLQIRLLVEPREEEARRVRGSLGRSSPKHPSRRCLDVAESELYHDIRLVLERIWNRDNKRSQDEISFICRYEYKLGLFFRKMQPKNVQMDRSREHLRRVRDNLSSSHNLHEMAQFWLTTLEDSTCSQIQKCPADYVVGLYSTFAERFDELMVEKLDYQTPQKLRQLHDQVIDNPSRTVPRGVDLGCGTGLSGEAFRNVVDHLTGVDLSPEMILKAKQRNCYEELVVGDVMSVLGDVPHLYDIVFACDVFVYIGDLKEVFQAVRKSLCGDGIFCFSVEHLTDCDKPYVLHDCARFAHSQNYIENLAELAGFEICRLEVVPIRKNQGKDVMGVLAVLRVANR